MAKTKIEVDLVIKGGESVEQVENKTKSLKTQLKEIKALLASGTLDSQTFNKLSIEAGQLQDRIADVSQRVKNLASDSQKLDALMSAAQGLVGGFAAVQGVAALLGDENEDLQKTMVKLQGAMSALAGIQAVANTLNKDSALSTTLLGKANIFNTIQTGLATAGQYVYATAVGTSTGAMKLFRIALLATGVGAIIVGIIALANAMSNMGDSTDEATEKLKKQNEEREKSIDLNREEADVYDKARKVRSGGANDLKRELDLLIAKGATEKQIYEAGKKLKEKELYDIKVRQGFLYDDKEAQIKIGQELLDKQNEIDILKLDFDKKQEDKRIIARKKSSEEAKKRQEEKKAASEKEMSDLMSALEEENAAEERQNERIRLQDEKDMVDLMAQLEAEVQAEQDAADRKVELDKQAALQALQDRKDIENAKLSIVNDSYLALNALGELALGQQFKNTNAGKALALAQIATDTALGFIQGLRIAQQSAIGLSGPAAALTMPVFYASQVAAVLGAASKAKSLLGGGGSTSAPSGSGGGGGGSVSSQPPRMDKFESNRPAMNPNQRVYVLEKDITDSQGRVAKIRHNATLI
jgi:hypothetical protein